MKTAQCLDVQKISHQIFRSNDLIRNHSYQEAQLTNAGTKILLLHEVKNKVMSGETGGTNDKVD